MALAPVQAAQSVLGGDEAGLADTVVAGVCVDTPPVVTVVLSSLALVLVLALLPGVHHGACRADTVERPHRVVTLSPVTQPGYGLTLVDVHTLPGVNVLQEAGLTLQPGGTSLAGMAPGPAYGGAAELAGADHALELVRALAVLRPPVTRPRPVVNLTVAPSEAVDTGTAVRSDTSPTVTALLLTDWLLAELPGVARPADTGVVPAGPAVQTGGGTASLQGPVSPAPRTAGRHTAVTTDADVGLHTFPARPAVVLTDGRQAEPGGALHTPTRAAVAPGPAPTDVGTPGHRSHHIRVTPAAGAGVGDFLIRALISALEAVVSSAVRLNLSQQYYCGDDSTRNTHCPRGNNNVLEMS